MLCKSCRSYKHTPGVLLYQVQSTEYTYELVVCGVVCFGIIIPGMNQDKIKIRQGYMAKWLSTAAVAVLKLSMQYKSFNLHSYTCQMFTMLVLRRWGGWQYGKREVPFYFVQQVGTAACKYKPEVIFSNTCASESTSIISHDEYSYRSRYRCMYQVEVSKCKSCCGAVVLCLISLQQEKINKFRSKVLVHTPSEVLLLL